MGLAELLTAFGQGQVLEKLGPDWIEKLKKLKIANAMSGLEAQNLVESGRGAAVTREMSELDLGQAKADKGAFEGAGIPSPKLRKFLQDEAAAKLEAEKGGLDIAERRRKLENMPSPENAGRLLESQIVENDAQAAAARALAQNRNSGGAGGVDLGGGVTLYHKKTGQPVRWFPETGEMRLAPEGYMGVTDARMERSNARVGGVLNEIMRVTEDQLGRYEASLSGVGRVFPTKDRVITSSAYQSSLQSLAQLFGRKVLEDTRVSDQDRRAYANALGVTNELIATLDPTEARRRLEMLKGVLRTLSPEETGEMGEAGGGGPAEDPLGLFR